MRTLVVCSIVSLDGFSAGPGGDVTALPFDEGFNAYGAERLRAADTVLTGRTSYEMFHGYWPGVADDPSASEVEREISREHNAARQVVISDSLAIGEDEPWSATTTDPSGRGRHDSAGDARRRGRGDPGIRQQDRVE
jgi:hypothetical protein